MTNCVTYKNRIVILKVKLSRYRPGEALGAPEFLDNRHINVVRL
jgi:hypothetical protein